jgi:hypothetical protein
MPNVPPSSPPPDPRAIVAQPAWETALRTKARDVLATLNTLAVQASPITFTVQGVRVGFSWGTNDAVFDINDGMYTLRIPLPWVTGKA